MRVVSLGHNCAIAAYLHHHRAMRSEVMVDLFDNMFTYDPAQLASLLLSSGGQLFENYEKLDLRWNTWSWSIKCKAFGVESVHDISLQHSEEEMIELLQSQKRAGLIGIKETIKDAKSLLLLRSNLNGTKPEDTIFLCDAIKTIRGKPFKMFVFQEDDHSILNSIPEISYYRFRRASNEGGAGWHFTQEWDILSKDLFRTIYKNPLFL